MKTHYKNHMITRLDNGRFQASFQSFRDIGTYDSFMDAKAALNLAAEVLTLWKAGKNIWEISQLTGATESTVTEITRNN